MADTLFAAWLIARKDLAIEFRTRSAFFSAVVFALLGLVIFYYSWDPTAVAVADLAPGVLWVVFTFSGLLGLHRSFGVETADHAIDGLLASPVSRESIFLGKAMANLIFVAAVQLIAIPALTLFYNLPLGQIAAPLIAIALLAAIGLVAVGTLFSAMAVNTRLAELLLPMLALPFFVPIVIAASQSTAKLLSGRPIIEIGAWIKLLLAFDVVFVAACSLMYPLTVED
ncbi:MAG TPA: heme exporter protein CcmB [Gemmatimonadaceae bacterium]|nr:heme exporter protein CcmB [Gemmatimonadaceae bacterium]